jgi:hypothetical protein
VVIGMMGSHHWGEVGYLLDPGMFFVNRFLFFFWHDCFRWAYMVWLFLRESLVQVDEERDQRSIEEGLDNHAPRSNPSIQPTLQPLPN